ncbi:hypothetical protein MRB53_041630 [Persea americana]|nr:hypothetical protein MRB53_041630 [Persea americana]
MRSSNKAIVQATEQRMQTCMAALKDVSKVWLSAKMVHTLFSSILGNKALEERLQKAAGRRHQKGKTAMHGNAHAHPTQAETAQKRKYDEVDAPFSNGTPAPQMSYERSRPQTPAITPSRELGPPNMPVIAPAAPSPKIPRNDAFMGNSRANTRPTTPFNPGPSYPGTPPDLFLVTRNSPTISQDLWNNFQPDQLFPADTSLAFPSSNSPNQSTSGFIDPQLGNAQMPDRHTPGSNPSMTPQTQRPTPHLNQSYQPNMNQRNAHLHQTNGQHPYQHGRVQQNDPHGWAHVENLNAQKQRNEETISNSSMSQGPVAPATLNVEDWFQFFGINGLNSDMQNAFQ